MRTQKNPCLAGDNQQGAETELLSVAEMIGCLRAIEESIADDPCLMDLAPEIIALRAELEERRAVAVQVAAEVDAENCLMPN